MTTVLSEYDLKYLQVQWYNKSVDKLNKALKDLACPKFIEKQYLLVFGLDKFPLKSGILKSEFYSPTSGQIQMKLTKDKFLTPGKDGCVMITDYTKWLCNVFFQDIYTGDAYGGIIAGIGRDFILETFYSYCSIWMSVEAGIKIM